MNQALKKWASRFSDNFLVMEIDSLRLKQRNSKEDEKYILLIEEAVNRELYVETPLMKERRDSDCYSFKSMVDNYGAEWYKWKGLLSCPQCGGDWCDRKNGPPYKLEITVKDLYNPVDSIMCPCCHMVMEESSLRKLNN